MQEGWTHQEEMAWALQEYQQALAKVAAEDSRGHSWCMVGAGGVCDVEGPHPKDGEGEKS